MGLLIRHLRDDGALSGQLSQQIIIPSSFHHKRTLSNHDDVVDAFMINQVLPLTDQLGAKDVAGEGKLYFDEHLRSTGH